MRNLRRHRDFLAWLMSVAVSCNIILAMVCCAPLGAAHTGGTGPTDDFASVLCTTSGVKLGSPTGQVPSGHKTLHSQCLACSHAPGGTHVAPPVTGEIIAVAERDGVAVAFPPVAALGSSHFAFAEPSSRGPPRA